jgi:hypothetical protein
VRRGYENKGGKSAANKGIKWHQTMCLEQRRMIRQEVAMHTEWASAEEQRRKPKTRQEKVVIE